MQRPVSDAFPRTSARFSEPRDRLLVAVAPDDHADELVRVGKRCADALRAPWSVVSVETPAMLRLPDAARDRRVAVLRLAESLGAETVTLDGPTPAAALLEYARLRAASRILVGEPSRRGWRAWLRPTTAATLLARARGIDVSVIARRAQRGATATTDAPAAAHRYAADFRWRRWLAAALISAVCTLIAAAMEPWFADANQVMVYLLGATLAGLRLGRGPAAFAAVLNIACFNFFLVPPTYTFVVADAQYVITLAVMLVVALTIATLTANVRQQTRVAGARERRTALLYAMSRELAVARDQDAMRAIAIRHVADTFASRVAVLLPDAGGGLATAATPNAQAGAWTGADPSIAQWAYDLGRPAGLGTDAFAAESVIYLPLRGSEHTLGVLAVLPANARRVLLPEQRHLLDTFAGQLALALERARLAAVAEAARVSAETETMRNTLLASISHDLRTPLAVIAGASSALADPAVQLDAPARAELAASIAARARDMSGLISNVLELMRFESGRVPLRRDWEAVDDLVALALDRAEPVLAEYRVRVALPEELPPVHVDAALIVQVLANLLENAARHTPAGTQVTVGASAAAGDVRVTVEDDGPGLPPGDPQRLFDKFARGRDEAAVAGAGLGLAIARTIVTAHGGTIEAANRPGGGASFAITLPSPEPAR